MFNLFKKKSPLEKLQQRHEKLLKEAYALSTNNRTASDAKYAEASEIEKKIIELKAEV